MSQDWYQYFGDALLALEQLGRRRSLRSIESVQGPVVTVDGRLVILCCSNDYLGLAGDSRLADAAVAAIRKWGTGSGASRLISGSMSPHQQLESAVADWRGSDRALLFNSGYHANTGTLPALAGRGDFIYSDALNHASIIDGCRLSRATLRVYPHADVAALAAMMATDTGGRQVIVTDAVFSMDADEAPLVDLTDLARRHDALLVVDEAHSAGVMGPHGRGLAADLGVESGVDLTMGTFGKALGSFGAYMAGSEAAIELLLNRARSFVFTTALPPAVCAASLAGLQIARDDAVLRQRVLDNAARLRQLLGANGWQVLPGRAPILPVIVGDDRDTMDLAARLFDRGILAVGIRPPTVPEGTARIRLTITAGHTDEHLEQIAAAFGRC